MLDVLALAAAAGSCENGNDRLTQQSCHHKAGRFIALALLPVMTHEDIVQDPLAAWHAGWAGNGRCGIANLLENLSKSWWAPNVGLLTGVITCYSLAEAEQDAAVLSSQS